MTVTCPSGLSGGSCIRNTCALDNSASRFSPDIVLQVIKNSGNSLPRINILKVPTGTNWSQQKEIMLTTYESLIRSLFIYAAPIWFPNTSPSLELQTIQNPVLHTATGCVRMTSIDHLHKETTMLPVQNHLSLITSQFLAGALQPSNPSHSVVTSPSDIRNMN